MNKPIKWIMNSMPPSEDKWLDVMSTQEIEKVRAFHRSFPQYAPTPLANLSCAAEALGLGGLAVKDMEACELTCVLFLRNKTFVTLMTNSSLIQ